MSQLQAYQSTNIIDIIDRPYENRTVTQHNIIIDFLTSLFSTITQRMAKLMSFYFQRVSGPLTLTSKDFSSQSYVIVGTYEDMDIDNPEAVSRLYSLSKDQRISLQPKQYALVLEYSHYLNCQALTESSIEQQVAFMQSSQFLCSIPKKRLYYLLKKSSILKYSINQVIYHEGQKIEPGESGSGVYLVRRGDFGYYKQSQRQGKQIEALQFSRGHLFGTLQLLSGNNKSYSSNNRLFTVKCKCFSGLVYRFSDQIFVSYIKPYCQSVINQRQNKLFKYVNNRLDKAEKIRQNKAPFLSQTLTRGFSVTTHSFGDTKTNDFPLLNRTRLSLPKTVQFQPKYTLSQKIQEEGLKKTNYLMLTKQGPLKHYPMISQRSNFTESQFKEFTRLQRNKQACQRLKQLKAKGQCSAARGQILFSFFKQTWNFDKQKKQKALSNRYN